MSNGAAVSINEALAACHGLLPSWFLTTDQYLVLRVNAYRDGIDASKPEWWDMPIILD